MIGMCVWDPVYGVDGPHPYGKIRYCIISLN